MRLRDYFISTKRDGRRVLLHEPMDCGWTGELHGKDFIEVEEIMSIVARHDEDCPCAEG